MFAACRRARRSFETSPVSRSFSLSSVAFASRNRSFSASSAAVRASAGTLLGTGAVRRQVASLRVAAGVLARDAFLGDTSGLEEGRRVRRVLETRHPGADF